MDSDFLSNVELYYVPGNGINGETITLEGDEHSHIVRVMRHSVNEEIYATDGYGKIFKSRISNISKSSVSAVIQETLSYENEFHNIYFCIPKLKSADRFEFALEKCTELGITNFIVYDADKGVSKGERIDRWQKILISAMKQSLRSYIPGIKYLKSLSELTSKPGEKIIFEQKTDEKFSRFVSEGSIINSDCSYYFVFGPEGGFSDKENSILGNSKKYSLTPNRLRAETAIITAASMLALR